MGRPRRIDVGGYVYHVINRAVSKQMLFVKDNDFRAFEQVLAQAIQRSAGKVELLAYCVMSNHFHLVLRTTENGVLSPFMKWLTLTHTQRYQVAHGHVGYGPLYQGRFKSFVIETGEHLLNVCRYVERNAARASLVQRAEDWQYSSLWRWQNPKAHLDDDPPLVIAPWPTAGMGTPKADGSGRPRMWLRQVNTPHNKKELDALRLSVARSRPFGSASWEKRIIDRFFLISTVRAPGRPRLTD